MVYNVCYDNGFEELTSVEKGDKKLLPMKVYPYSFTYCILVDSSIVICWTNPFVISGVSGQLCRFYSIFDGKSC